MPTMTFTAIAPRMAMFKHLIGATDPISGTGQIGLYIDPTEGSYDGPSCWLGRVAPKPTDPPGTTYTCWQPFWTFDIAALPRNAQITNTSYTIWVDQVFDASYRSRHAARVLPYALPLVNPPATWVDPRVPGTDAVLQWSFADLSIGFRTFTFAAHPVNEGSPYAGQVDRDAVRAGLISLVLIPTENPGAPGIEQAYRRLGNDLDSATPPPPTNKRATLTVTYTVPDPLNAIMTFHLDGRLQVVYTTTMAVPELIKTSDVTLQGSLAVQVVGLTQLLKYADVLLDGRLTVIGTNLTTYLQAPDVTLEGALAVSLFYQGQGGSISYPIASPTILEFDIYGDGGSVAQLYETLEVGVDFAMTLTAAGFGLGGVLEVGVELAGADPIHAYRELFLTGYVRGDLLHEVTVRGR